MSNSHCNAGDCGEESGWSRAVRDLFESNGLSCARNTSREVGERLELGEKGAGVRTWVAGPGDGDLDGLLAFIGPVVGVPDGNGEGTGS